ncbi:hypothetical protein ACUHMQ_09090 [Chitinimonas sp. PSY-7]|uniref:hypothetical protein n=1 Tax=Chitinimonas sp. PSY-7 TaxID=3459088 RepID=UPI0040403EDB
MANKDQERAYAQKAAELLPQNWEIIDIPEPPDFEIKYNGNTFGLEIRQVFNRENNICDEPDEDKQKTNICDDEIGTGSPTKYREVLNSRKINRLAKLYYQSNGKPIRAVFHGNLLEANMREVLDYLLKLPSTYPTPPEFHTVSNLTVHIIPLPNDGKSSGYPHWQYVDDRVGWVGQVSPEILQNAIDRKAQKLDSYKKKYNIIDLLLVADHRFNSGKLDINESTDFELNNPGFRNIYFLSFPDSIKQIA